MSEYVVLCRDCDDEFNEEFWRCSLDDVFTDRAMAEAVAADVAGNGYQTVVAEVVRPDSGTVLIDRRTAELARNALSFQADRWFTLAVEWAAIGHPTYRDASVDAAARDTLAEALAEALVRQRAHELAAERPAR